MRKILLCLAVAGVAFASIPQQSASAVLLPVCRDYCCTSPNATPATQCWGGTTPANKYQTTCAAYLAECP